MRTSVDIPDRQFKEIIAVCASEKISRAELIRQAIAFYLEKKKPETADVFGLWKDNKLDGMAYQVQARSEW